MSGAVTTIDLDVAEELEAEQLIVNGRYRIHPNGGGKPKLYTRATTWADLLEDSAQLRDWRCRMVAIGLGQRQDLLELIQATPVDDKKTIDVYCEQAVRIAAGDAKANRGTAAHGFFARILGGVFPGEVPDSLRADIEAAIACLQRHGLRPVVDMIEAVLVNEELGVAGRTDLVCADDHGRLYIVDLKSGAGLVQHAQLKTAMQLAIYAHADTVYDPDTHTHRPMPPVDQDVAYVLHRPLGADTCDLIAVDITAGWRYASEVVTAVRAARNHGKRKGDSMFTVVADPSEITPAALLPEQQLRAWILGRLTVLDQPDHANAKKTMRARWPEGVPPFAGGHQHTKDELNKIVAVLDAVEAQFEIPFGETDPTTIRPGLTWTANFGVEEQAPTAGIDEGDYVTNQVAFEMIEKVDSLDLDVKQVLNGWASEAHAIGRNFSLKLVRSRRRVNIYQAILNLSALIEFPDGELESTGDTDTLVRATIALVVPDAAMPTIAIGEVLGVLTIDEAAHLAEIALAVAADPPALTYDPDNGAVRWARPF